MQTKVRPQPSERARLVVDVAEQKLASDIVMLDLRGVCDFADYFVIMTAESDRQLQSLAGDVEEALEQWGAVLHHREGGPHGGWLLLDYGDVVVHVFRPEERDFYDLEEAWSRGVEAVRIQ
jgi:ribosome-associated protein